MRVGHEEGALEVEGTEAVSDVIEVHALIIVVIRHRNKRESDFYVDRLAVASVPHRTSGMVQYDRLSVEFRSGDAEGGMDFESAADRQTLGL